MKIYEAIKAKLDADATVLSLAGVRIYPLVAEQTDTLPLIIYDVTIQHDNDLSHGLANKADLQVDCHAANFDAAMELAYAVRTALHVANATWGSPGVGVGHCAVKRIDGTAIEIESGMMIYIASVQFSLLFGAES